MNPSKFHRQLRPTDGLVALLLAWGTLAALLATMNVGFPRDEGFYFRYAAIYQSWLSDVWNGEEEALSSKTIDSTWKNNREHPPLAKVLFGLSWGNLAEKRRPINRMERSKKGDWVHVSGLRRGEGFKEGESIVILRPRTGAEAGLPSVERVMARATIDAVRKGRVRARVNDGALTYADFKDRCGGRYGPPGAWSGCEAVVESDLGKMEETTAFRFPTAVWMALLVGSLYLFGTLTIGRFGALFAALSILFIPRHFYHAHLTTFDVPVMTMIFWLLVSFWFSLKSRRWALVTGVLFGLALLTKLNAFFIPVVLGLWWLTGIRRGAKEGRLALPGTPFSLPPIPRAFWTMPLLGFPIFVLFWPRLWFNGWEHFVEYVRFHMEHEHYMQNYFGEILAYPPFPLSFPFGMTLFTVPLPVLLLGIVGGALLLGRGLKTRFIPDNPFSFGAFLGIHALFPIVLIALPSTPVFGGIKHWMTAMPFFALLGGLGFERMRMALFQGQKGVKREVLSILLLLLCLIPGVRSTLHVHPEGTASYNTLIGGLPGAADASMQRQFWGGQTRQGLEFLNKNVPRGAKVYFHKSPRGCWDLYRKEGLLRADIQHVADLHNFNTIEKDLSKTAYAVYHHQKSHDDYELAIWRAYETEAPVWQYAVDGVPLLSIYRNERKSHELERRKEKRQRLRKKKPKRPGIPSISPKKTPSSTRNSEKKLREKTEKSESRRGAQRRRASTKK